MAEKKRMTAKELMEEDFAKLKELPLYEQFEVLFRTRIEAIDHWCEKNDVSYIMSFEVPEDEDHFAKIGIGNIPKDAPPQYHILKLMDKGDMVMAGSSGGVIVLIPRAKAIAMEMIKEEAGRKAKEAAIKEHRQQGRSGLAIMASVDFDQPV